MFARLTAWGFWLIISSRSAWLWLDVRDRPKLPMQWGVSGAPTWYAPPLVALGFIPFVAAVVLGVMTYSLTNSGASPLQLVAASILFLVLHIVYTSWVV